MILTKYEVGNLDARFTTWKDLYYYIRKINGRLGYRSKFHTVISRDQRLLVNNGDIVYWKEGPIKKPEHHLIYHDCAFMSLSYITNIDITKPLSYPIAYWSEVYPDAHFHVKFKDIESFIFSRTTVCFRHRYRDHTITIIKFRIDYIDYTLLCSVKIPELIRFRPLLMSDRNLLDILDDKGVIYDFNTYLVIC